jgi:ribonuclease R
VSTTFPGADGLLVEQIFARLDEAGQKGLPADQLRRRVGPEAAHGGVRAALAQLEEQGRAIESEGRWFSIRQTDWIAGTLGALDSGDFLLRTGLPGDTGLFIRRHNAREAIEGDRVLARRLGRKGQADWKSPEGTVVKVLSERQTSLVGTLDTDETGRRWLVPFDPKVALELQIETRQEVPDGHYVVATVERGSRGRKVWGRVAEVLGDPEVPGVDVLVVLRHYRIPEEFPTEVLAAAAALPSDPSEGDWKGREDLRGRVVVTIDGEKARDFDDAVSIERLPKGGFRLGVHIADVAHYAKEGSPLDLEAYRRGTSVYYPERAVPMLPERLSNGLCSLRPRVPRLTVSVFLDCDRHGQVHARRFAETVIQSTRRLTYTEVRRILEEPRPEDEADYGAVLPALRDMGKLMQVLNRARVARGSIDFDLPEGDVELDTDGVMVGVLPGERNVAHRLVEEFMIAANEAVAFELVSHEVPGLFRVHDPPHPERLEELRELLAELGFRLEGEMESLHPAALQKVLAQVQGHPEEPFVSSLVLRSMQRAVYDPECRGHYALASRYYTHFTSPIRRYPDLVVHRQLKALLRDRAEEETAGTHLAERLPVLAEHTSTTERRAEQSERDLLQWKKVRFLAGRVGERFAGRITGVQPFGLFVQLLPYYVDGLVPIRSLVDDFYRYEPEAHRLVGERTGRVFKLGDAVEVKLVGVSLRHRGLDFELADLSRSDAPAPGPTSPWWLRPSAEADRQRQSGGRRERDGEERRRSEGVRKTRPRSPRRR